MKGGGDNIKNKIIKHDNYHIMYVTSRNGEIFEVKLCYKGLENGKPKYKVVYLHRIIMGVSNYEDVIDHINFDTFDNRIENLRVSDKSKNALHRKSHNCNNSLGVRNVAYDSRNNKYIVQITIDRKNRRMGEFDTIEEAEKYAENLREIHHQI